MKTQLNGVEIAYTDQGQGTPVLFVHGFPLNQTMWEPQVKNLSSGFRVLTLDLRGHGDSEAPLWRYSVETYADDIRALLDHLSIDQVVLAGFSMGGYVTFAFCRKYPDRVKALVLADTRPQADSPEAAQTRFKTAQTAHRDGATPIADAMVPKLLSPQSVEGRPDLVQAVRQMITGTPVTGIAGDLMSMADRPDSVSLLSEIRCPVLVLVGELDGLTPPADAQLMADQIPNASLEMIPEAAHLSNLEQPERFTQAVQKFLETV